MKFHRPVLVDSGISGPKFRERGYEVEWSGDWVRRDSSGRIVGDPGDTYILSHANEEKAILVTADIDHRNLVFAGHAHCGIVMIRGNFTANEQVDQACRAIDTYAHALDAGAIVQIHRGKPTVVISPAEIEKERAIERERQLKYPRPSYLAMRP